MGSLNGLSLGQVSATLQGSIAKFFVPTQSVISNFELLLVRDHLIAIFSGRRTSDISQISQGMVRGLDIRSGPDTHLSMPLCD
jgi:hypothetical protein